MTFLTPSEWSEVVNAEGLAEHNNTFPLEDGIGNLYIAKPRILARSKTHSWCKSHGGKKRAAGLRRIAPASTTFFDQKPKGHAV